MGSNLNRFWIFAAILLNVILLASAVQANFACGEVKNSEDNFSAAWQNVRVYYSGIPEKYASCKISPSGNRFCCDAEAIPGKTWKLGEILVAEVYDNITGYAAGPVYLTSSAEGFDIFPEMQIGKVIRIYGKEKLIFSNFSSYFLNASFRSPYNNVSIEKNGVRSQLCANCGQYSDNLSLNFGTNKIKIEAFSGSKAYSDNFSVTILNESKVIRKTECSGCNGNLIRENREVNFTLIINLSHAVENLELKEYIPSDFQVLDSGEAILENYSASHQVLIWRVSGKQIERRFVLKSPKIFVISQKRIFRTDLEDKMISVAWVTISKYFSFFSWPKKMILNEWEATRAQVSPQYPFVMKPEDNVVLKIGIFPKTSKEGKFALDSSRDGDSYIYEIKSSLADGEIDKMCVEFKLPLKKLEKYNFEFLALDSSIVPESERDEGGYKHYSLCSNYSSSFALRLDKKNKSLLDRLLDLFG